MKIKSVVSLVLAGLLSVYCVGGAMAEISRDDQGNYFIDYDKAGFEGFSGQIIGRQGNGLFDFQGFINSSYGQGHGERGILSSQKGESMSETDLAYYASIGLTKEKHYMEEGKEESVYYTYTPADVQEGEKVPLVVVNHGHGSPAASCEAYGWCEKAGVERLMLLIPEEVSVESLHTMLADVKAAYPVDTTRVYMVGNSMGGMITRQYAGTYPEEIAAIGPVSNSFVFIPETDGDAAKLTEMMMPTIFVAGATDAHNVLPVGAASTPISGTIENWNDLLRVHEVEGYDMTKEESDKLVLSTLNIAEHYAGVRLPEDVTIHEYVNCRAFQYDFTNSRGVTTLSLVIGENHPHFMHSQDVDLMWDFMKQFGRNQETSELMLLK